jgi:hypothetical protein
MLCNIGQEKEIGKTIIHRNYQGDFFHKSISNQRAIQEEEAEGLVYCDF